MFAIIKSSALSLGLSCMLAAAPALAEPDVPTVSVHTADLDLATAAGEHALHGRVLRAVRDVCGDANLGDLRAMAVQNACRATALAKAAPQVEVALNNARSRSAYAANSGKAPPPAS